MWLGVLASPCSVVGEGPPQLTVLPLAVHIACEEGRPVVPRAFVERQLKSANQIFAAYHVQFAIRSIRQGPLPTRLESRRDRDRLGRAVRPGVINWFVVASLRDVDEPGRMRRGVHWHHRGQPPAHYVIVAAYAEPGVLAHELGHFLGNRPHSSAVGNLMSYDWRTDRPVLDGQQQRRLARAVQRYLRSGELRVRPAQGATAFTSGVGPSSPWAGW